MSTFEVKVETIATVEKHPNADALDIVTLTGKTFRSIVRRGDVIESEAVVYFPVDAVLPAELQTHLGLKTSRIKTIRLRGEFSQGLVIRLGVVMEYLENKGQATIDALSNLADALGVTKYDAEEARANSGFNSALKTRPAHLLPLPDLVYKYDIEGAQNYPDVVELLMDQKVYITEKVEGTHWWASITRDGITVGQRSFAQKEDAGTVWQRVFYASDLPDKMQEMFNDYETANRLTFRGELIGPGIQGNYYDLDTHRILLFDIEADGKPIGSVDFFNCCSLYDLPAVPIVLFNYTLHECLSEPTIDLATLSTGNSLLNPNKLREGIVIKPRHEQRHHRIGRLFLKYRSPEYLLKSDT